ncbi:MAG TPA: magnesium chelatase domain-containing protein, partial [Candidatus Krumholzibacteria bacterium]|nr:magnesium chelatase domain-containing protein [Candidatus Krumholzibacteria bacterium]
DLPRYLVPRQVDANGLAPRHIRFTDAGLMAIIEFHTREAGVRNLEREIGSVCRKVATDVAKGKAKKQSIGAKNLHDYLGAPSYSEDRLRSRLTAGVVTGLAWTQVGGKILYIEGLSLPGGRGNLKLTGQVGSVMQESASAAYSYLRNRFGAMDQYAPFFAERDIHIHLPAGAIPKDGPSAGIAMASVLLSLLMKRAIDRRTAMTGEITLTGEVLPIGGLLEKVLAAHRAGIRTVIIPLANETDLETIPDEVRSAVTFVPVSHVDQVWDTIFPGVLAPNGK